MAVSIIVEIGPDPLGATLRDPIRPHLKLWLSIIVPVPSRRAVKSDIDFRRCLDQHIGELRPAARTEDDARIPEGGIDALIPPARVPERSPNTARMRRPITKLARSSRVRGASSGNANQKVRPQRSPKLDRSHPGPFKMLAPAQRMMDKRLSRQFKPPALARQSGSEGRGDWKKNNTRKQNWLVLPIAPMQPKREGH